MKLDEFVEKVVTDIFNGVKSANDQIGLVTTATSDENNIAGKVNIDFNLPITFVDENLLVAHSAAEHAPVLKFSLDVKLPHKLNVS